MFTENSDSAKIKGAHVAFVHFSRKAMASSGGRSTIMNPFAPASKASCTAFSSP